MNCYICNGPASLQCPHCTRYACSMHTTPNPHQDSRYYMVSSDSYYLEGPYFCSDCADREQESLERIRHGYYWCDFCEAETDDKTYQCEKRECGKKFCKKHGKMFDLDSEEPNAYLCTKHYNEYRESKKSYWNYRWGYEEKSKSGCFIATCVYGDVNAPEVIILRRFRDEVLLSSLPGKSIVSFYYLFSPYAAKVIDKSNICKSIIKATILRPTIWLMNYKMRNKNGTRLL